MKAQLDQETSRTAATIYLNFLIHFLQYLKIFDIIEIKTNYYERNLKMTNEMIFGSFFSIFSLDCITPSS